MTAHAIFCSKFRSLFTFHTKKGELRSLLPKGIAGSETPSLPSSAPSRPTRLAGARVGVREPPAPGHGAGHMARRPGRPEAQAPLRHARHRLPRAAPILLPAARSLALLEWAGARARDKLGGPVGDVRRDVRAAPLQERPDRCRDYDSTRRAASLRSCRPTPSRRACSPAPPRRASSS